MVLRHWIETHTGQLPPKPRLEKIWPEVAQARVDSNPRLILGQYAVRRYKNRLFLVEDPIEPCTETVTPVGSQHQLPQKLGTLILHETTENAWLRAPACR